MRKYFFSLLACALISVAPTALSAQTEVASTKAPVEVKKVENTKTENKEDAAEAKTAAPQSSSTCESCRWFEPTAASFSMRYRTTTDANDVRTLNQGQQRVVLAGKFKFDKKGRYSLNVHASSGYYFNWAYADTGLGNIVNDSIRRGAPGMARIITREVAPGAVQSAVQGYIARFYPNATPAQIAQLTPVVTAQLTPIVTAQVNTTLENQFRNLNTRTKGWNLYVRQLYFQAKPVNGLELSYGSLPINKGVNSEATSFDDDGYIAGGRVAVKRADKFWFDEISGTVAYFGDVFTPNFFRRTKRFGDKANYAQFLLRKKFFGGKVNASADYTYQDTTDTVREAVVIDTKGTKIFDNVRAEAYQRLGDNMILGKRFKSGYGFYIQGEKTLAKKLTLTGGFANIDRFYTVYGEYHSAYLDWFGFALNGDQTGVGKRLIAKANYKLTKDISVSTMYSQTLANDTNDMRYYWNKTHFNVALTYDILQGVKRLGWFK